MISTSFKNWTLTIEEVPDGYQYIASKPIESEKYGVETLEIRSLLTYDSKEEAEAEAKKELEKLTQPLD